MQPSNTERESSHLSNACSILSGTNIQIRHTEVVHLQSSYSANDVCTVQSFLCKDNA